MLLWLPAMVWLFRFEAFPHLFAHSMGGYREILADSPLVKDSWMRIMFDGVQIGYSHTLMDMNEDVPSEDYTLENETVLDMNIMGESQRLRVTAVAALDALYRLERFRFALTSDARYAFRLEGKRLVEDTFDIVIYSPAGRQNFNMDIPDDVIVHSPLLEMNMASMRPGQEMHVKTLDPTSMGVIDVTVRALRRETLDHQGRSVDTMVMASEYQGARVLSWVDADGNVLRQETPFGWVMEACTPEEAVSYSMDHAEQIDLLGAVAIPVKGHISDPRHCAGLEVRLKGLQGSEHEFTTDRQTVLRRETDGWTLRIVQQAFPEQGIARDAPVPADVAPYLNPSTFIQSDHDKIRRQANRITGEIDNRPAAARAICNWVYRKVRKDPSTSLPSALDVLHTMKGDCNEHTWLFTALARAAGIPARVCIGVVYMDGAFYYHAWPAVYLGTWIEMDPTFGQVSADATHIYMVEGADQAQMKLLSIIGKVEAEILEEQKRNAP